MKNFDEDQYVEHLDRYMMIAVSMAMFIGFALGWLAYMVSEAFA